RADTASHEIGQCFEPDVGHSPELVPFAIVALVAIERGLAIDWRRVQCDQLLWPWSWQRHFFWRGIVSNGIEDKTLPNRICGRWNYPVAFVLSIRLDGPSDRHKRRGLVAAAVT